MAKFTLLITANVGDDSMVLYKKDFDKNIMEHSITNEERPVLDRLLTLIPCGDWQADDGDDVQGTTYCQYAWYEDGTASSDKYVLGSWVEIDETTGCWKL